MFCLCSAVFVRRTLSSDEGTGTEVRAPEEKRGDDDSLTEVCMNAEVHCWDSEDWNHHVVFRGTLIKAWAAVSYTEASV